MIVPLVGAVATAAVGAASAPCGSSRRATAVTARRVRGVSKPTVAIAEP